MKRKSIIAITVAGLFLPARPISAVLLGLLLIVPAAKGQETPLEVFGGAGGNSLRADCEPGSYVVGFTGRAGDWMDQISIVCGRWNEKTQTLQPASEGKVSKPFGDSTGGDALSESCPDGWAVSAYQVRTTLEEWNSSVNVKNYREKFVHGIRFHCRPPIGGSGQVVHKTLGSWSTGDVSRFWGPWSCPPRELATGMHGRAGLFVDAFGLVCNLGPEPAAVGVETKTEGGPVVAPGSLQGTELKKGPISAGTGGADIPAGGPPAPAEPSVTVLLDVEVFDQPGGIGKGIGELKAGTQGVSLAEPCRADNWCHVKGNVPNGNGWVWSGPGYQALKV